MTQDQLINRVERIYDAIDQVSESNLAKLPAKVLDDGKRVGFMQDFSGGLSGPRMENRAHSLLHNIVCLRGYIQKWASDNGHDTSQVQATIENSRELKILQDLYNEEKHVKPRIGGASKLSPKLVKVKPHMKLETQAKAGSSVVMTFGPGGVPKVVGNGSAKALISGEVIDGSGNRIGDLVELANRALNAWESLLKQYGLPLPVRPSK
jgi:hypothetical protein